MLSCNIILTQGFKIVGQLLMNSDVLRVERIALFLALQSFRPRMPIRVTLVHRVIAGVGVAVGADTRQQRVPVVGRDERAAGDRSTGVEVLQAGFGVEFFADPAL